MINNADTVVNRISIGILIAFGVLTIVSTYFVVKNIIEIIKKKRSFVGLKPKGITKLLFSLCYIVYLFVGIYYLPNMFFNLSSWNQVYIYYPTSLTYSTILGSVFILVFCLNIFIMNNFPKADEKPYFSLIVLSVYSGISYAFLMVIINEVISGRHGNNLMLIIYFIIAFIGYIFSMKIVRRHVAKMANNLVFNKRVDIITKILKTPFEKLESIGNEKIYSSLNNDTEVISNTVGIFTIGITCIISIICCFIYLSLLSFKVFMSTAVLIAIFGVVIALFNKIAARFFSSARDIQNTFFKFINDLLSGFKELSVNRRKSFEFREDMFKSCRNYRNSRLNGEIVATNVYFTGELMAISILGCLVFVYPLIFKEIDTRVLRDYIFLLLYMKGPIDNILNLIPRFLQARISFQRINNVLKQIEEFEEETEDVDIDTINDFTICLEKVEYEYKNKTQENFKIGPIDIDFNEGELVFITGGNGSGKSTLIKILTGLYKPDSGRILINDKEIESRNIGEYTTPVFSDFYLFEKLYGINYSKKIEDIKKYLSILELDKKVSIDNGQFNTIRLSTGQKKRLALLISYLEDRPIYVFDEWAADQDPEFREIFYLELLPELKQRGKCIIAITHDDRYFKFADKLIKMETGKIISVKKKSDDIKVTKNKTV